jgi:hypothetical protein
LKVKTFFISSLVLFWINCTSPNQVDKSESDRNLLLALLSYNEAQTLKSAKTEINGYWITGFYAGGAFTASGNLIVSTNLEGTGTWSNTSSGSFSNDSVFRIVQYDNVNRRFFYQQGQGNNNNFSALGGSDNRAKYGRIDWTAVTSTDCEKGASRCFYYCERVNGKDSLSAATSDTATSDSSNPKTTGCGSFAWSKALFRTGNPAWGLE